MTDDIDEKEVDEWFSEEEDEVDVSDDHDVEDPASKYSRSQLRVVREAKDYHLDYLRHALGAERQLVNTSPAYQRRSAS